MSLETPEKVRTLQRKLYRAAKAKRDHGLTLVSPARHMPAMKPVGKPDAGNPHVRFDERGRETGLAKACYRALPRLYPWSYEEVPTVQHGVTNQSLDSY